MVDWLGYQRLRKGRIHVYCPKCGRKMSNVERGKYDPPSAELVHTHCDRCGAGGKESDETFFDGRGRQISWAAIERQINRALAAERREVQSDVR